MVRVREERSERAPVDEARAPSRPRAAANVGAMSMLPIMKADVRAPRTSGPRTTSGTRMSVSYAVSLPAGMRNWPRWKPLSELNTK